jgi:hypothetical protein
MLTGGKALIISYQVYSRDTITIPGKLVIGSGVPNGAPESIGSKKAVRVCKIVMGYSTPSFHAVGTCCIQLLIASLNMHGVYAHSYDL